MKVQFFQSGGFVGAVKGCELDTAALPAHEADELQRLVQASGISTSGEFLSNTARDLKQYEIAIDDGAQKRSVVFDDATFPPQARPLLGFLMQHARPVPGDR